MKNILLILSLLTISMLVSCESMLSSNFDYNLKKADNIFTFSTSKEVTVEIMTLDQEHNKVENVYHEIFCNGEQIAAGRSLPGDAYKTKISIPTYVNELLVKSGYGGKTSEVTVSLEGNKLNLEIPKSSLQIENSQNLSKSAGTAENTYTIEDGAANFTEQYAIVRYRSFDNTGGEEIYLGTSDIDDVANRNEEMVTWQNGETHDIVLEYDANNLMTTVSIGANTYTENYFVGKAPENHINTLQIDVVERDPQGVVELKNVSLNGNDIGSFSGDDWATWKAHGFDFTKGFILTAELYLGGNFTGNQEKSKVQLTFGYDNSYQIDTDGDGVMDNDDEYDDDPKLAFNNPTTGTLAFEDLWPKKGDYDFNDMVVDYTINQVTNADNDIAQIRLALDVVAAGAQYNNAFGIEIPGLLTGNVSSVTGDFRKQTSLPNTDVSNSGNFVIVPFDNVKQLFSDGTYYINTKYYPTETIDTLKYTITLGTPVDIDAFATPPYNPFIIINSEQDSAEVHLMGQPATFFDTEGMVDPYKDDTNMPWAINIAEKFDYPLEDVDIRDVFNNFQAWSESDGTQNEDWYKDLPGYRDPNKTYTEND